MILQAESTLPAITLIVLDSRDPTMRRLILVPEWWSPKLLASNFLVILGPRVSHRLLLVSYQYTHFHPFLVRWLIYISAGYPVKPDNMKSEPFDPSKDIPSLEGKVFLVTGGEFLPPWTWLLWQIPLTLASMQKPLD